MPPVLAGRGREQQRLVELCEPLTAEKRAASRPGVLIGPRGNGKTVLLAWFEQHLREQNIATAWLTPNKVPTIGALAEYIAGNSPADRRVGSVKFAGRAMEVEGSATVRFDDRNRNAPVDLTALLTKRAQRSPFALLIDEAHALDHAVGTGLLNAAQEAAKQSPVLLVLAGTPDLKDVLDGMSATFWSRCMPVGVGRLKPEAAKSAIEDPLRAANIGLGSKALWDRVLDSTQGYPYFVQVIGDALWKTAFSEATEPKTLAKGQMDKAWLVSEAVESAVNTLARDKQYYYSRRYKELDKLDLLDCACRVAECYREHDVVHHDKISKVVASCVGDGRKATAKAVQQLAHVGYIWASPDSPMYFEPGIPSLMSFLAANRPYDDDRTEQSNPAAGTPKLRSEPDDFGPK